MQELNIKHSGADAANVNNFQLKHFVVLQYQERPSSFFTSESRATLNIITTSAVPENWSGLTEAFIEDLKQTISEELGVGREGVVILNIIPLVG